MKKLICMILAALMILSLAACGGTPSAGNDATVADNDTAAVDSDKTVSGNEKTDDDTPETEVKQTSGDIDIDLTAMSSTMIYSEVQNMMQQPDSYIGLKVKMEGQFNVAEVGGNRYFACLIKDATACCASGIEFDWKGDHSYPADYPEENAQITVTGTFTTYKEGEATYCQLKDAELQF